MRRIRAIAAAAGAALLLAAGAATASAAEETVTVFDPGNVTGADGWQVTQVEYDPTCATLNPPEGTVPFDAIWSNGALAVRADRSLGGSGCYPDGWSGYETAPNRWVIRKTFTVEEAGTATVVATGFRGDGGARVRVNGVDAGLYGQWNQPATDGTVQVPVTAGVNVIEIEVRDVGGPNWVMGRLDVVTTVEEIPLAAPALALGAGVLALGGVGGYAVRRRGPAGEAG